MAMAMKTSFKIGLSLIAMFTLAACGHRGDLERPPPMWGKKKVEQTSSDGEQETDAEEGTEPQHMKQQR